MMSIVVIFGLDEQHGRNDRQRAYDLLGELGLSRIKRGILLPKMTVLGEWHNYEPVDKIRDIIAVAFHAAELKMTHLLVAEYTQCAWYGLDLDKK